MEKINTAVEYFNQDFNCCQSILMTFGSECGLDKETAIKLGSPFGGGIVRTGEVCGAVTSALMILGLKYGKSEPFVDESDKVIFKLATKFLNNFKTNNGSVKCLDLLNIDLTNLEERKLAEDKGILKEICPKMVNNAAEILQQLL